MWEIGIKYSRVSLCVKHNLMIILESLTKEEILKEIIYAKEMPEKIGKDSILVYNYRKRAGAILLRRLI